RRNGDLIRNKPEQILTVVSGEKSVFDRHDIARALHRSIDEPQAFQNAFAAVMASPVLVELTPETATQLARYSTREMIAIEQAIAASAGRMSQSSRHPVQHRHVERALRRQDDAIRAGLAAALTARVEGGELQPAEMQAVDRDNRIARAGLSDEQRIAVGHITGPAQIAAVIGFAGAGKSTMLAAAREAWEAQGYRVHGAALAGKAAEGLEESSGIPSSTLASWEHRWQAGRGELGGNDVLVIDEAGMVASRQLARFVGEAEARGAKLVLVGDHEQLQAIGAGAPFRAIAERIGAVALSEIRRQTEGWQREASIAFATHRTGDGLSLYADRGAVRFEDNRDEARAVLVRDYLADLDHSSGSRIALAHRRVDVAAINADIRAGLQERGRLARGVEDQGKLGRELVYQTNDGKRCFAPGDRIVLLENNRELKVKNGMLGTVEAVERGALQIRLDGRGQAKAQTRARAKAQLLSIPVNSYQAFDHGYATTIHKAQGATVDRAIVLASATMDRHLTYVAMTRHREGVQLYAGRDEFKDMTALAASMGRSGAKETTLDYVGDFAARRGLAEAFGIRSDIGLGPTRDIAAHSEKVEPLVPALTSYSRSIEAVARERARPEFERAMEAVRSVGRHVYAD
ncbi:MAG: Ti-type conjugative transfer relaxase TraA, partial [Ensifer adhaerens]